jgi:hypothetical protein
MELVNLLNPPAPTGTTSRRVRKRRGEATVEEPETKRIALVEARIAALEALKSVEMVELERLKAASSERKHGDEVAVTTKVATLKRKLSTGDEGSGGSGYGAHKHSRYPSGDSSREDRSSSGEVSGDDNADTGVSSDGDGSAGEHSDDGDEEDQSEEGGESGESGDGDNPCVLGGDDQFEDGGDGSGDGAEGEGSDGEDSDDAHSCSDDYDGDAEGAPGEAKTEVITIADENEDIYLEMKRQEEELSGGAAIYLRCYKSLDGFPEALLILEKPPSWLNSSCLGIISNLVNVDAADKGSCFRSLDPFFTRRFVFIP